MYDVIHVYYLCDILERYFILELYFTLFFLNPEILLQRDCDQSSDELSVKNIRNELKCWGKAYSYRVTLGLAFISPGRSVALFFDRLKHSHIVFLCEPPTKDS